MKLSMDIFPVGTFFGGLGLTAPSLRRRSWFRGAPLCRNPEGVSWEGYDSRRFPQIGWFRGWRIWRFGVFSKRHDLPSPSPPLGALGAVSCASVVVFLAVVFGFRSRTPLEGAEARGPGCAGTRHWN